MSKLDMHEGRLTMRMHVDDLASCMHASQRTLRVHAGQL